jgi:putative transcriptional regulator
MLMNRVLEYRKQRGLTQVQLAAMSGVSLANICEIEKYRRSPTIRIAWRLARALGVSLDSLFPDDEAMDVA